MHALHSDWCIEYMMDSRLHLKPPRYEDGIRLYFIETFKKLVSVSDQSINIEEK